MSSISRPKPFVNAIGPVTEADLHRPAREGRQIRGQRHPLETAGAGDALAEVLLVGIRGRGKIGRHEMRRAAIDDDQVRVVPISLDVVLNLRAECGRTARQRHGTQHRIVEQRAAAAVIESIARIRSDDVVRQHCDQCLSLSRVVSRRAQLVLRLLARVRDLILQPAELHFFPRAHVHRLAADVDLAVAAVRSPKTSASRSRSNCRRHSCRTDRASRGRDRTRARTRRHRRSRARPCNRRPSNCCYRCVRRRPCWRQARAVRPGCSTRTSDGSRSPRHLAAPPPTSSPMPAWTAWK